MRKRIVVAVLTGLSATLLAAPAASAGVDKHNTVKIDSRVTWARSPDKPTFIGSVRSSKHACRVRRLVKVFERTPGRDHLIGKDRSNRRGKWRVIKSLPGFFYAKALRREVSIAGTTFVCRADRTRVIDTH
jgi:hypothetical protein